MSAIPGQSTDDRARLRTGVVLEVVTLAWNVVGVVVLALLALQARSIALFGFGLDSLVEIGASAVVLWELQGVGGERERRALTYIAVSFAVISIYLGIQSTLSLASGSHAHHSPLGIAWIATTAAVMFVLAWRKLQVGKALCRQVLIREGRVTFIDGLLAVTILLGLSLNAFAGWWWADPAATYFIVGYGLLVAVGISKELRQAAT
jgi:divalent metal cation (Fe/Co/Zn/Cd) transporter